MFDSLQEKLTKTLRNVQGKGKLSERNMEETLKEIRIALLESDVNYKVVKDFLEKVRQESIGQDVLNSVEPGQLLVKIVHDQIIELLAAALVQDINDERAVDSRDKVGQQPQGTVLDRAVRQYPGDGAGEDGNEADRHCDNGGNKDGFPELFHQGIEHLRVDKRGGAVPDKHQVRPAFPDNAPVIQCELDIHGNGKEHHFEDQQGHAFGKGFIHEGRGSQGHQKGKRNQDESPVLDEIISQHGHADDPPQ